MPFTTYSLYTYTLFIGELTCIQYFLFSSLTTSVIYTLSLHDALPIFHQAAPARGRPRPHHHIVLEAEEEAGVGRLEQAGGRVGMDQDRKSTRLNSSHGYISYAVFCLKKKKEQTSDILSTSYLICLLLLIVCIRTHCSSVN